MNIFTILTLFVVVAAENTVSASTFSSVDGQIADLKDRKDIEAYAAYVHALAARKHIRSFHAALKDFKLSCSGNITAGCRNDIDHMKTNYIGAVNRSTEVRGWNQAHHQTEDAASHMQHLRDEAASLQPTQQQPTQRQPTQKQQIQGAVANSSGVTAQQLLITAALVYTKVGTFASYAMSIEQKVEKAVKVAEIVGKGMEAAKTVATGSEVLGGGDAAAADATAATGAGETAAGAGAGETAAGAFVSATETVAGIAADVALASVLSDRNTSKTSDPVYSIYFALSCFAFALGFFVSRRLQTKGVPADAYIGMP